MLKVYFTAATSFDGNLKDTHRKIIEFIEKNDVKLVSGRQIVNETILAEEKKLSRQEIFMREKALIDEANCIIAEVSKPSLGVGSEIEYGLMQNKPVLALLAENQEDRISPMIAGNPSENLFLEYYNTDKIPFAVNNFLSHVVTIKDKKGKLIVIDGGDGSGKTTQAKLLVAYLKQRKLSTKYMDFPQYYNSFHGKTVAKFLRGEFGNINQVSPYLASLAYALDRASVKQEMEDFLKKGGYIIANRYATSNMAHQGAKLLDQNDRKEFLKWVYELEYKIHRIPKEDVVIYLYVPWQIGANLTDKKGERKYLAGAKADIHEKDRNHRQGAEEMYLSLAGSYRHWIKIDCFVNNVLLSPQEIHTKIIDALNKRKV